MYSYTTVTGTPGNGCTALGSIAINYARNGYHLPTEAQWEYAARAGTTSDYYWGKDYDPYPATPADTVEFGNYAVWGGNSSNLGSGNAGYGAHPVAEKLPNSYGLYDMSGNLWEWCNDWYDAAYYGSSPGSNPQGPAGGTSRVVRGGGWDNSAVYLRSARRYSYTPANEYNVYVFRVVRPE